MNKATAQHPQPQRRGSLAKDGLRLYLARGTPNSNRAEQNLGLALKRFGEGKTALKLEVVDVFVDPKRAIRDGIIVTPTLIGFSGTKRLVLMGDLSDTAELDVLLESLRHLIATVTPGEAP